MLQKCGAKPSQTSIGALAGITGLVLLGSVAFAAQMNPPVVLPTSFIGEAATLALAFAAPALCAGGYMALRRLAKRTGAPLLVGLGFVTAASGLVLAISSRLDLFAALTGT
jgi:hypothetical protein